MRDLTSQIQRREKQAAQLEDDVAKGREKVERLLATIDELQAEETRSALAAKRAERDLREEKEKGLRLERELGGWKGLRMERGVSKGYDGSGSVRGHERVASETVKGAEVRRMLSESKGFL